MARPGSWRVALTSVALLPLLGCTNAPDPSSERAALLEADRAWAAAAAAGDIDTLSSYWAPDAVNFFPGAPVATGRDSILQLVARNRSIPGFRLSWHADAAEVAAAGDMGYTTGPFELSTTPNGVEQTRTGHYVAIWKKEKDGRWACTVESTIFGPDTSAPAATAGADTPGA